MDVTTLISSPISLWFCVDELPQKRYKTGPRRKEKKYFNDFRSIWWIVHHGFWFWWARYFRFLEYKSDFHGPKVVQNKDFRSDPAVLASTVVLKCYRKHDFSSISLRFCIDEELDPRKRTGSLRNAPKQVPNAQTTVLLACIAMQSNNILTDIITTQSLK